MRPGITPCMIKLAATYSVATDRFHLPAALGKLQALELSDLVSQFLDHRLIAVDLLAHRLNGFTPRFDRLALRVDLVVKRLDTLHQLRRQGAQLFRGQVVAVGSRSHGVDFAKAGNSRR